MFGLRKRVLVLAPDFPPGTGGIQVLLHRLVKHMSSVDLRVLTGNADRGQKIDRGLPCRVVRLRAERILGRRAAIVLLNAWALIEVLRFKPDVVISGHIVASPSAWVISFLFDIPYVQYAYGKEIADRKALARFAAKHAAAVIAISAYTEQLLHAAAALPRRLWRIPPGVDGPSGVSVKRAAVPIVITVARLADHYKGHDVMIRAFPLVRARVPECRWIVVGDGPLRAVYGEMVRALGVTDGIDFLGSVDDLERDRRLEEAWVFAMPSRFSANGAGEGFGIVYLEAGTKALPVIGGNGGGAADAVVDGVTGVLVDATDHVAVADAIAGLLLDTHRSEKLGKAGLRHTEGFRWPDIAGKVEEVVREVASATTA